jgi:uncharacterized protein YjiK
MNRRSHAIGLLIIPFMLITSCSNKKENTLSSVSVESIEDTTQTQYVLQKSDHKVKSTDYIFPYDVKSPSKIAVLHSSLIEISSLTFKDGVLYATNDEKGYLFKLDPDSGKILERQRFGTNGDYEGVESTKNGEIYILKSNGDLFIVGGKENETQRIKTELSLSNDVEGLGYLAAQDLLLLACKGSPNLRGSTTKMKDAKAVYSWSIKNKKMNLTPHLLIKDSELISHLKKSNLNLTKSKKKKLTKRLKSFAPSAIAYNEIDNMYYLLSTVGKLLVVISSDLKIAHIEFLDHAYFAQPEGICFDQNNNNNNMYVSNEGRGLIAKILKFERK